MTKPTRRSVLRASMGMAAAAALTRPYIANAAATTATVWWTQGFAEEEDISFMKFIERENLGHEEGSLFSYLVRVMNFGNKLHEATKLDTFATIAEKVRSRIAAVDRRMAD